MLSVYSVKARFPLSEPDSQHDDLWSICPSDCEPQLSLSGAGSSAKSERWETVVLRDLF